MSEKNPFFGATFAERKAAREAGDKADVKQVDADVAEVEDKAVGSSETKKRSARKRS